MKVLIITYYWPPAGGSGVQRWLKFVKYLQQFDIEPVIYTVENANYPKEDKSLIAEIPEGITILKQPIWEPTNLLFWKKKKDKKKDVSNATNSGLLSFIRGNFFIPDPKIFWVKPSVRFLSKYLEVNKIDAIISTGPPHAMHLIGNQLKKKTGIKWIADFRDPWSNLYYNQDFKQLNFAKKRNQKLEKSVLKTADCILTVSKTLKIELEEHAKRVAVISNGFDDELVKTSEIELDNSFSISYIGLLPKQSNPKLFFKVIRSICNEDEVFKKDVKLNFIGDISDEVKDEIYKNKLEAITSFVGYVNHKKAIAYQRKSQVLLLLVPNVANSEGILTGKLFEYLTARRPILAMGSETGDLAKIIAETKSGVICDFDNEEKLTFEIKRLYHQYKTSILAVNSENIQQYHRKNLTEKLATLIRSL